jgi:hypothetical protein
VKFDSVSEIIGTQTDVPRSVDELFSKQKIATTIDNDYAVLKEILLSKI